MKVSLIRYHDKGNVNTRLPESLNKVRGTLPPIGLAYIASYLEQNGHEVQLIDAIVDNLGTQDMQNRLEKFSPELVGITAMTSTLEGSLEAARIAKKSGAKIVFGGAHMSAYPKETLSHDYVDFGVIGDGEVPMVQLIEALEGKMSFEDVQGLVYKDDPEVKSNGPFVQMDLDVLPSPAYHLLPLNKYSSIISSKLMTTMITGRGCPYRCGFCFTQPTDKFYRMRNPVKVVDEMEMLMDKHGINEIMFYDDTIAVNRKHIEDICNEILTRKLKIRWESPCRVDDVDHDLLKLMAKSGCFRLRFGVESGNPQILKLMNKKIELDQVETVFKDCKKLGIETFAYFIIGYAQENERTIQDTIDFSKRIEPDLVMFTVATPYPFTHLYRLAVKEKLFEGEYWKEFTLGQRTDRIPYFVKDSDEWVKKAYRQFYFRPLFLLKRLFMIRSIDDVKKMYDASIGILFFKMSK